MENEQEKLSIEAKHCIDIYLESRIRFWFVAFGITNVIFLLGAFSYIYFVLPGKAINEVKHLIGPEISQAVQNLTSQLQNYNLQIQTTLIEYGQAKEKLRSLNDNVMSIDNTVQQSTIVITDKIKKIDGTLNTLEQRVKEGKIESITNLIIALEGSQDTTKGLFEKLSNMEKTVAKAISKAETANDTANAAVSKLEVVKTGIQDGSIVAQKSLMLRARDDGHWLKFHNIDSNNHDVFELWRTDNTWHPTIKVQAANEVK